VIADNDTSFFPILSSPPFPSHVYKASSVKDFLWHMSIEDSSMFNDLPGFVTRDFYRPAVHRVGMATR
jgi:hypothetical protein